MTGYLNYSCPECRARCHFAGTYEMSGIFLSGFPAWVAINMQRMFEMKTLHNYVRVVQSQTFHVETLFVFECKSYFFNANKHFRYKN